MSLHQAKRLWLSLPVPAEAWYSLTLPNRKRTKIPIYSFEKHARLDKSTVIYSPHVLILEGIFALHDPRVLELMDMRVAAYGWSS